ncbi:hypothetical protein AV530_003070 [Patagioenas fasciata monilis]|uniref:Uncharacterized protein n=1 Tax=Patagioenas fasciata monilis TaxID=372326 RepID=A0A1V4KVZ8_PATFA|nr:hypothetical protein AV530_003070 [Patagioenas fasciata monilis]
MTYEVQNRSLTSSQRGQVVWRLFQARHPQVEPVFQECQHVLAAVAGLTALLPLPQKLGAYDAKQLSDELQHQELGLNQVHKEAVRTRT